MFSATVRHCQCYIPQLNAVHVRLHGAGGLSIAAGYSRVVPLKCSRALSSGFDKARDIMSESELNEFESDSPFSQEFLRIPGSSQRLLLIQVEQIHRNPLMAVCDRWVD